MSHKVLNYIKSSCIICCGKMPQYFHIVYIKSFTHKKSFLFLLFKNSTIFQNAMLLALILQFSLFKSFVFFKFNMPSQKSDMSNSIRTIFIKFIIKINVVKIYIKYTHFIKRKYDITRIFIKIESIFICVQSSKKFFNLCTCNKPIGNKFQCCQKTINSFTTLF